MKKLYTIISILTIAFFSVTSCEKEENESKNNALDGLVKLSEGYAIGASAKVEVWAKDSFFVGYNKLTIVLYDSVESTKKITDAQITFNPLMTMTMGTIVKSHACPIENPADISENDMFCGAVAFNMPTTMDGIWELGITVTNNTNNKTGKASFDINVSNPENSVLLVFTSQSADSSKLILTMIEPQSPEVGVNDIEFTIHKKVDMMNFPADDTYSIEITPEMPSMGHGSPNNVNPTNIGNGHYKGSVNFTMTGEWKVNVLVKKDSVTISKDIAFTIVL